MIAERTGYSLNTVSLSLRHSPRIQSQTAEMIRHVADEMGYAPNAILAAGMAQLRSRQPTESGAVIVALHESSWSYLQQWAGLRRIIEGIQQRGSRLGYHIHFERMPEATKSERTLLRSLYHRNIAGAITIGRFPERRAEMINDLATICPVVAAGGVNTAMPVHYTLSDHYRGVRRAVKKVIAEGSKRPGLVVSGPFDQQLDSMLTSAFWGIIATLPKRHRIEPLLDWPETNDGFMQTMRAWALRHQPDAILTNHKTLPRSRWREALKPLPPVRLVQLGHTEETPDWEGVTYPGQLVGHAAIDMVVAQIHRGEKGMPAFQKCTMLEGEWVDAA